MSGAYETVLTRALLTDLDALFADRLNWIQHEDTVPSENGFRGCLMGGIWHVAEQHATNPTNALIDDDKQGEYARAMETTILNVLTPVQRNRWGDLTGWNDAPSRTFKDVKALIAAAVNACSFSA